MKKFFKVIGYLLLILIIGIACLLTYVKTALPNVGSAPELKVERTPERVERGKYLANHVTVCMDCHSTRDWRKFTGPLTPGTLGKGGELFDHKFSFPGSYYSRNITPAGISRYTDGELFRVITTGVDKEGKAIFPVMPYPYYGRMDPEDIKCIIAYIRTLDPVENKVPAPVSDFPMNFIINLIPKPAAPTKRPDPSNTLAYGGYLINACACRECHTKVTDKGQIIPELAFSGGREFPFPDGSIVRTANLTPDVETGLGNWPQDMFINKFQSFADSSYQPPHVNPGEFNSMMPWTMYGKMTKEDLSAIYAYLHSLPAIKNEVVKYSPASIAKK